MKFKVVAQKHLFLGILLALGSIPHVGSAQDTSAVRISPASSAGSVRLKDIAHIDVTGDLQLVGYGLVVGLGGTGDSRISEITRQSMGNVLEHMGINVDDRRLYLRNSASVISRLAPTSACGPGRVASTSRSWNRQRHRSI